MVITAIGAYLSSRLFQQSLKRLGLRLNPTPKARIGHHRPIDCGPLDIDGGVVISGELMLTHDTTKLSLTFAVVTFGMSTRAASLAGVRWIDKRHPYAEVLRLVANKRPQLTEGPIAVSRSLPSPLNPRPRPYALAVFKDKRPLRAFGFGNEPLADVVIRILLKTPLVTSELPQAAFGRLRSDPLKCLTTTLIPLAAIFDMLTRKRFTIAIGCHSDNAQVNAQDTIHVDRFWYLNLATHEPIPFTTD
jgi:hypothetical protein